MTQLKPDDQAQGNATRPGYFLLILLYIAILALPLLLAGVGHFTPATKFVHQVAIALGLLGLMIVITSFILAARYQWVARPFGLDAVLLFHRRMAVVGFAFILLHIALMAVGHIQLLTQLWLPWNIQLGRVAILLLIVQIVVSLYRAGLKVEYEKWRITHRVIGLGVLLFAFSHAFFSSHGFAPWPMRLLVVPLAIAAFCSIIWSRVFRPGRLKEFRYQVADVREIHKSVWQINLKPAAGGQAIPYRPGQFAFFNFHRTRNGLSSEEHVWTIASSPTEPDGLMLAVKELGDFTRTMNRTVPGDAVTVHGPFGLFSHTLHPPAGEMVFIAAGIGITPFRSMIRWIADRGESRPVLLLYANKSADDIPFLEELSQCQRRSGGAIRIVNVLSRPAGNWTGEKGHIDIALINKYLRGILADKTFWVCGPAAFTTSIIRQLRDAGVPAAAIHNEAFCLVHAPVQPDGRGTHLRKLTACITILMLLLAVLFALAKTDFLQYRGKPHKAAHPSRHGNARSRQRSGG